MCQCNVNWGERSEPPYDAEAHFRPDICRYIYICLVRRSYRKSPFARPKMAAHPLHLGSCTLYRGGGLPPGLHFATAPHRTTTHAHARPHNVLHSSSNIHVHPSTHQPSNHT